ncbi:gamma-tubulin complex component 3 homolog [Aplysia californica]|uniref:Gamma-tubulin complex component 3 homolog n=1 Tax=Aplysia californica TaxID=6500 RepID=A0ABM1ACP7_APLCA|nr:gamma-tubulin complex component 3 homolog [Aplysia californica]
MASYRQSSNDDLKTVSTLLLRLCSKITGCREDAVLPQYEYALKLLASKSAGEDEDEFRTVERLKNQLVRRGREKDGAQLADLHRRLQSQMLLRNRSAVLTLLQHLARFDNRAAKQGKVSSAAIFSQGLPSHLMSTPFSTAGSQGRAHYPLHHQGGPLSGGSGGSSALTLSSVSQHTGGSSGISSIRGREVNSGDPNPIPQSFMPSHLNTPVDSVANRLRTVSIFGRQREERGGGKPQSSRGPVEMSSGGGGMLVHRGDNTSFEISEQNLIKDLIFVLQGIDGQWIKVDPFKDMYKVDSEIGVPKGQRGELLKLSECGWLYNKIKSYVDHHSTDKAFGLVGQSFCAALHQELTEYLRLVAVLEAQLQQDVDPGLGETCSNLTLARLRVWLFDPLKRLKWLAALVDICKGKKGGALSSTIFSYTHHGDTSVKTLITHVLTYVSQPIYATLLRWMYDGELDDTYHEFFVASDPTVKNEQLWHDKYSLRKSMIPSFISMEQASKILLTGKSINFLRQVCEDRTPTKGREVAMGLDLTQAVSMFSQDQSGDFQNMLDSVYQVTSQQLLDVLQTKYKFLEHLKAMRRYLLLGQGDFIRHLMDLLEEDLAKPASNLYLHNLTGILETAIRATNAQFDDADILRRLDVRLLDVSPGDTGWDVFSLEYRVDGPIRTVFTPECKIMYLRVFNFMWRAKRMEYVLAQIWKGQAGSRRELQSVPELWPVLHQCHMITSSMVHFIKQVQYYINFEVLECTWDELLTKVHEAKDLDYIIAAHQVFLDTVLGRCLLNDKSTEILQLLRTVFDLIIQFETAQAVFYKAANDEVLVREAFDRNKMGRADKGDWETTEEIEREEKSRRVSFLRGIIPSTRAKLQVLSTAYRDTVEQFLKLVVSHPDASLRCLCFRLDFNEHYKVREPNRRMTYLRAN